MHQKETAQIPSDILFFWKAKQQQYSPDEDRWRGAFIITPEAKNRCLEAVSNSAHSSYCEKFSGSFSQKTDHNSLMYLINRKSEIFTWTLTIKYSTSYIKSVGFVYQQVSHIHVFKVTLKKSIFFPCEILFRRQQLYVDYDGRDLSVTFKQTNQISYCATLAGCHNTVTSGFVLWRLQKFQRQLGVEWNHNRKSLSAVFVVVVILQYKKMPISEQQLPL